jgi:squalene synthase HpnC
MPPSSPNTAVPAQAILPPPGKHYENFPVASLLLPRRLVPAVQAIYAFARSADDIADEGDATAFHRLEALQAYEAALDGIEAGVAQQDPMFARLAGVIAQYNLPLRPLRDLLSAFRQDVAVHRYTDYPTLLDYCARSANPVGLLMLHLYGAVDEDNVRDSNAICTALQVINFLQDVAVDMQKERIYLPLEELAQFAVMPAAMERPESHGKWRSLMRFQVARVRALMLSGAPLALRLPGRMGWELRMVVQGGLRILECIEAVDYDVFRRRPQLQRRDWLIVAWRAYRMKKQMKTFS